MVFYVLYKYAMKLPESPKEIVGQVVDEVTNKFEEALPVLVLKVEDAVEDAVKNVDKLGTDALNKFVERVPQAAKAVALVDEALAGASYSCGLFGWTISMSRARRSPAKSEDPSNVATK
jgi:hypothetical protein